MDPNQSDFDLGLHLEWDTTPGAPTYLHQLGNGLRQAIRRGQLRPGVRLPSTRTLALQLGCSRWVVVQAYEQLVAEGYLSSRTGSGTRVQNVHPVAFETECPAPPPQTWRYDFRTGIPDLSLFPRSEWVRATRTSLAMAPTSAFDYGEPSGLAQLRSSVADYLGRVRGAVATADDLVITNGAVHALAILSRALRRRGIDRIGVEDPGWIPLRAPFDGSGVTPVPIPVDDEGIDVDGLEASGARAVLVSPAHAFPFGSTLSPGRRARLLEWADRVNGLVIEDDYDAEYRYDRRPLGVLQGIRPDRVVLIGSVSKSLAPALRIGWMVHPRSWRTLIHTSQGQMDTGVSVVSQLTFSEYLESGGFERHLRRMRKDYAKRRNALVSALADHFPRARLNGVPAGLHLMVDLGSGESAPALSERAQQAGVRFYPIDRYFLNGTVPPRYENGPVIVLGYGSIPSHRIPDGVAALAEVSGRKSR